MKLQIEIGGKKRHVEMTQAGELPVWTIDGQHVGADATEVSPGIYSILINGKSFEVRLERSGAELRAIAGSREFGIAIIDEREWRRNRGSAVEAEGRQKVLAPMPGKIVHVLVKIGDAVRAGQGLLVVEAMKMQNEIRAPKSGTIDRLAVVEGQTVNAGEVVAIVS
ncbi:MAG: biotin/lipoyl-containing protein [Candidatus Acidiferrales bacterium]